MITSRPGSAKPYKLSLPKKVVKALDLTSDNDYDRIRSAIRSLASSPRPQGAKKLESDLYRIRIGRYRVVYSVDDRAREIIILKVAKRDERTYDL
ncbi:MAG: type II toxin-antitoxin system RelE/ParE family toxin [Candidatus Rokubacteria bacterium]|nr:type II toxin-antitoxin system RelE/ParE family toxin [Candidatus Rokubacteria bacterium]MBI2553159.1 type II toxin-antitoxin system RelE/ParE family toxin [Candidatus Rokubacteria bacterium]